MKELILIRHSNAESGSFSTPDFDRKLSAKGKDRVQLQANILLNKHKTPDLIITSSAKRALETAHIFSDLLNKDCPIQQIPFLYEDFTTCDFFNLINKIGDSCDTVILVGHNPTISVMASRLDSDELFSFKPCTMCVFEVGNKWANVDIADGKLIGFFE